MQPKTLADQIATRFDALKQERSPYLSSWEQISEYFSPTAYKMHTGSSNEGFTDKFNRVYDNRVLRAPRTLAAGLLSGMTSPSRQWLRHTTSEPELDERPDVKKWLADITRLTLMICKSSNVYQALHALYGDVSLFGTGARIITEDFENVIHCYPAAVGEFAVAGSYRGVIDTFYREFEMTTEQIVDQFGYNACSDAVRKSYDQGNYYEWHTILHAIEPRRERRQDRKDSKNMPYRSVYMESKQYAKKTVLRESGFERFPVLAPRWDVFGSDFYGRGCGIEALGEVKQLNNTWQMFLQAMEYAARPVLSMPAAMKNKQFDTRPGGRIFREGVGTDTEIKNAMQVTFDGNYALSTISDLRQRVDGAFYTDLFLMLNSMPQDRQMTATEVAERHEEKLLVLGPVLERLHTELLSPLVEIIFERMVKARILPQPPESLMGKEIKVEFDSMLAQAQKAVTVNSMDRFVASMGVIAQMKPDVLDKFDQDQWADVAADSLGLDPELIIASEDVVMIRQDRAQQQAQMNQLAMAEQQSKIASNVGRINPQNMDALAGAMPA